MRNLFGGKKNALMYFSAVLLLLSHSVIAESAMANMLGPFITDGCSMFPDGGNPSDRDNGWIDCCINHDKAYWIGGTFEQKTQADQNLYQCAVRKNYPKTAHMLLNGPRFFGTALVKTGWHWGFGWKKNRGYEPLGEEELKQVRELWPLTELNRSIVMPQMLMAITNAVAYDYCIEDGLETLRAISPQITGKIEGVKLCESCSEGYRFQYFSKACPNGFFLVKIKDTRILGLDDQCFRRRADRSNKRNLVTEVKAVGSCGLLTAK